MVQQSEGSGRPQTTQEWIAYLYATADELEDFLKRHPPLKLRIIEIKFEYKPPKLSPEVENALKIAEIFRRAADKLKPKD